MIKVSCPICGREMEGQSLADWPSFPFCSPRCKMIDLGRWLDGTYQMPAEEPGGDSHPGEPDTP
jgi:endogenous inhibitor of DNA gyrase (YacG/DUF329 family)